jgi:hypothetical protein
MFMVQVHVGWRHQSGQVGADALLRGVAAPFLLELLFAALSEDRVFIPSLKRQTAGQKRNFFPFRLKK